MTKSGREREIHAENVRINVTTEKLIGSTVDTTERFFQPCPTTLDRLSVSDGVLRVKKVFRVINGKMRVIVPLQLPNARIRSPFITNDRCSGRNVLLYDRDQSVPGSVLN